ncbi:NADP-dependent oxidoreductase [Staphylococcus sp. SQ8-PEA]|uniref:NADP-dependent oxidoreductase n=1 Tax=Staphylococcus marylandisciuri TaxID=2981529 RepID=A0ABT2QN96_9STAP|nr:NADP-dependent oxidoreductase [Staphylococcus marylandisciuri]MCU5745447.1 NADP-dependent oxidoreductase [Staphylococcus marylandisciuri]
MRAMVIDKYGKRPVREAQVAIPEINDNDVRVKIKAASVNPIDYKIRDGKLKPLLKFKFPLILGNDFSGVVTAVGANVRDYQVGDKVFGRPSKDNIGTFAEFIAIDKDEIAHMPRNLSFEEAASIPLVGLTAYQALNEVMQLQPGSRVLIQAGSGGVGTFSIQLAKTMGLEVATTVSDRGVELVKELGADQIINYKEQDFSQILSHYDGVFDTLGGQNLDKAFHILKRGGTVASISGMPTEKVAQQMNLGRMKQWMFRLASRKLTKKAKQTETHYEFLFMHPSGKQLTEIKRLIEDGKIQPVVDRVFNFEETQGALEYSEEGHAKGKVVIRTNT